MEDSAGSGESGESGGTITLWPMGLAGLFPSLRDQVRLDPMAKTYVHRGRTLDLRELRHLEVERGFLNLGTTRDWDTIDLYRYRDRDGPLVTGGVFNAGALRLVETIKSAIRENRGAAPPPGDLESGFLPLELRSFIRIDFFAVSLTLASLIVFVLDLWFMEKQFPINWPGLIGLIVLLAGWVAGLVILRRSTRIICDQEGITKESLFRKRSHRWKALREYRRQLGELEIGVEEERMAAHLEVLAAGGTPLVLRRGRYALLTLPARLFLGLLKSRLEEKPEPAIEFPLRDRRLARLWLSALLGANVVLFTAEFASGGPLPERLVALGALNQAWRREPWRLLTALFLHASFTHLLFNMIMLIVLGPWVGRAYGWFRATVLYLAGGFLGNLIGQGLRGGGAEMSVGASTAILALLGALLGAVYRRPQSVPLAVRSRFRWAIPATLVLTLALGLPIPVMDWAAHLGGFLAGFLLSWPIPPIVRPSQGQTTTP